MLRLILRPATLSEWVNRYYPGAEAILLRSFRWSPLVVLAGDVGSGKTELAETIGDLIARSEDMDLTLFPLSLATRGQGRVGEMTQLISQAFDYTFNEARRLQGESGQVRGGVILLIDEADALAQSRETTQMHHEDRAGVNALIRGIDRLGTASLPAAVIMCTNRLGALDPAVQRRALDILTFQRPNGEMRWAVLSPVLERFGLSAEQIKVVVQATGASDSRAYGFTFSDLTQRLIPTILLEAYPDRAVDAQNAVETARRMVPTPPFRGGASTP